MTIGKKTMMQRINHMKKAQTAVEYLLLLGVVTAVMLVAFKKFLPKVFTSSDRYYNTAAEAILDRPVPVSEDQRENYP
jgi:hypothetical protein